EVREQFGQIQRELEPLRGKARWVAPASIHITLKFIGEIPDKRIEAIDTAISRLTWKAFIVTVSGVGFFPGNRSPRVFWAGIKAPTMQELAEQLDSRLESLGFEKENREFRPHITLARARDTTIDSLFVNAASRYAEQAFGSFSVDRISLVRSVFKPSVALYQRTEEH